MGADSSSNANFGFGVRSPASPARFLRGVCLMISLKLSQLICADCVLVFVFPFCICLPLSFKCKRSSDFPVGPAEAYAKNLCVRQLRFFSRSALTVLSVSKFSAANATCDTSPVVLCRALSILVESAAVLKYFNSHIGFSLGSWGWGWLDSLAGSKLQVLD